MLKLNIPSLTTKSHELPKFRLIRQEIPCPQISDIKKSIHEEFQKIKLEELVKAGDTIAITASSRGIPHQALILKIVVNYFKKLKTKPFIIPAMGSHGGGTIEGQLAILHDRGITERNMGCPIKATMEVVKIEETEFGMPVVIDKHAASADKIFLINQIKSHSKFIGDIESGLSKMCLMGLGKHFGAKTYHQFISRYSWKEVMKATREILMKKTAIIGGLAIIQNINDEIAEVHALRIEEIPKREPLLLKRSKELTEKMPFRELDLLIIDEMGKNIFGTGMNPNICGRKSSSPIDVQWVFIRGLTEETRGNAQGIGLADFTTKRVIEKIDLFQTYTNALTAYRTDSPKLPVILLNDQAVLNTVAEMMSSIPSSHIRIAWIKNTLKLKTMLISEALLKEVESNMQVHFIGNPEILQFDGEGFLLNSKKYW